MMLYNNPLNIYKLLRSVLIMYYNIKIGSVFLSPKSTQGDKTHANFVFYSGGLESRPSDSSQLKELNFEVNGNSSLGLKAEVSLPWM